MVIVDDPARLGKPETFDFLGLTHICGRTMSGKFLLHRRTMRKRMRAKLREIKEELQRRMHDAVPEQGRWLRAVVSGYFAYHAVPTNVDSLAAFRTQVGRLWLRVLRRRSQRHRLNWARMARYREQCLLPRPHPAPMAGAALRRQNPR